MFSKRQRFGKTTRRISLGGGGAGAVCMCSMQNCKIRFVSNKLMSNYKLGKIPWRSINIYIFISQFKNFIPSKMFGAFLLSA